MTIEFVVIVPLMLLTMLGFSEVYMYMRAVSLVEHTAFTLADSLGQMSAVINDPTTSSSNSLGSIWNAADLDRCAQQPAGEGRRVHHVYL